jgi:hypothetical protein
MTAAALLHVLRTLRVALGVEAGYLILKEPAGVSLDLLEADLRRHKAALLRLLAGTSPTCAYCGTVGEPAIVWRGRHWCEDARACGFRAREQERTIRAARLAA